MPVNPSVFNQAAQNYGSWYNPAASATTGATGGLGASSPSSKWGLSAGMGGLGAALGMGLGSMFGGSQQDPFAAAQQSMSQIPGYLQQYLGPYAQAGMSALPQLQQQYGQLINNPGALLASMGSGFQQSPGYQWDVSQATNAANQAAAAGGMTGSPAEQQQLATTVTGLANQDYQNYLNNVMGLYGQGLSGLGGLYQTGYGASSGMGEDLSDYAESQANLAAAQANWQNQQQQGQAGTWGGILGGLAGAALPFLF